MVKDQFMVIWDHWSLRFNFSSSHQQQHFAELHFKFMNPMLKMLNVMLNTHIINKQVKSRSFLIAKQPQEECGLLESYQNSSDLYFLNSTAHFICFWNWSTCLCVCVCDCMRRVKESTDIQKQNEKLIKEEKRKKFMFAFWHTCEKPCVICARVCQRLSLKSKGKRLLFPCLCFIQQDTHIHINTSIMNCVYTPLSREKEEVLFVYLLISF